MSITSGVMIHDCNEFSKLRIITLLALPLHDQPFMNISRVKPIHPDEPKGHHSARYKRRLIMDMMRSEAWNHSNPQDVERQAEKNLVYAIIIQAYADIKRYWKHVLMQPGLSPLPYYRIVQNNYLRREYEASLAFFFDPYEGDGSYMEYLLFLAGEGTAAVTDILDAVQKIRRDVEKFSLRPHAAMGAAGLSEVSFRECRI
jgi:hypothetical protein